MKESNSKPRARLRAGARRRARTRAVTWPRGLATAETRAKGNQVILSIFGSLVNEARATSLFLISINKCNNIIGMQLVDNQIPKMKILYLIFSPSQICYQRWRMKCCWLICGVQIKICRFSLRVWRTSLPAATLSGIKPIVVHINTGNAATISFLFT